MKVVLILIFTGILHSEAYKNLKYKGIEPEIGSLKEYGDEVERLGNVKINLRGSNALNITDLYLNKLSIDYFPIIFKAFENLQLLSLSKSGKIKLKENLFGNTKITHLILKDNTYLNIEDFTFRSAKRLKYLHFRNNFIEEISQHAFGGLEDLQDIDLSENKISKLKPNVFNCSRLEALTLGNNHLQIIEDFTFRGAIKLKYLDLNHNEIFSISTNSFGGLLNLRFLILNDNKITQISPGCFQGTPKLTNLVLLRNSIKVVHDYTFLGSSDLEDISFDENQIVAIGRRGFKGLISLNTLSLQENVCTKAQFRNVSGNIKNIKRSLKDCIEEYEKNYNLEV